MFDAVAVHRYGALIRVEGLLPRGALHEVLGVGKGRDDIAVAVEPRGPAAVVEVQVSEDHEVDVANGNPVLSQVALQLAGTVPVDFPVDLGFLGAHAGVDEDVCFRGHDEQAIESQADAVFAVWLG